MTLVHILFCFARLIIDSWGLEKSVDFSSGNFLYRIPHRFFFGSEAFQIKRCSKTTPLYLFVYFRKMCFNEEKNVSLFFLKCRFWNVAPFFFCISNDLFIKFQAFGRLHHTFINQFYKVVQKYTTYLVVILHTFFGKHFF